MKTKYSPTDTAMVLIVVADTLKQEGYSEELIDKVVRAINYYEALLSFAKAYINGINLPISAVKQVISKAEGKV